MQQNVQSDAPSLPLPRNETVLTETFKNVTVDDNCFYFSR